MSNSIQKQGEAIDPAIVEAIVREVMNRLNGSANPRVSEKGTSLQDSNREPKATLELVDRVITLESVRNKLDGISNVLVIENSVVTPAVRDELNSRKIQLGVKSKRNSATQVDDGKAFCVARLSSHFVAADWLRSMGQVNVCCGESYCQLADKVAEEFSGLKTLCFAAQPYVAVAELNQNAAIRAAYGRTPKEIVEIKSTLDANVLVLDAVQARSEQAELVRLFVNGAKGVA